nr:hypothetical protein [Nannocystis sp.]
MKENMPSSWGTDGLVHPVEHFVDGGEAGVLEIKAHDLARAVGCGQERGLVGEASGVGEDLPLLVLALVAGLPGVILVWTPRVALPALCCVVPEMLAEGFFVGLAPLVVEDVILEADDDAAVSGEALALGLNFEHRSQGRGVGPRRVSAICSR